MIKNSYEKHKEILISETGCNSPIFSTETAYALSKCAINRTITFSLLIKLVSLLFTPVYYLPAKPISHQLSQRECFYLLV